MTDIVERLARVIATALGDNYADAFKSKERWTAKRGISGGRFRDCNEPFQSDYLAAAQAALEWTEAATEIERLRDTLKRVQVASLALDATRAEIYDHYRKATVINTEAVATLDSEREANSILTAEIERLRKHAEEMAAHLEWAHEGIERGDLGERMCCDGRMCGCMGALKGDEVLHYGREALAAYRAEYPEEK